MPTDRQFETWRRWGWGGVLVGALILAVTIWWWMRPISVQTAPGATATRTLPDGSTVELNADTRLAYPRTFSTISLLEEEQRRVRLHGEAYIEVEEGERPFVVETPTARIEVLGTAFAVRSRSGEDDRTHVALAEGRLRVEGKAAPEASVTLQPEQAVTMGPDGPLTAVRDTSLDRVTVWRRDGFAVTDVSLTTFAQTLERHFGVSIQLDSSIPEPARSAPLTLYYAQDADLEQILHDVCIARNLTYWATADGYVLARTGDMQASRGP